MPGGIQVPLEQWLVWPVPNYINPHERSHSILICASVLGSFSILILFARLWVRIRLQQNAGLDDWLMLAAFVRKRPSRSVAWLIVIVSNGRHDRNSASG
jgi:hypothetical protein